MLRREQQRCQGIVAVVQCSDVGAHNAVRREGGRDKCAARLGQVRGLQGAPLDQRALYLILAREGAAEAPALPQRPPQPRPRPPPCELPPGRPRVPLVPRTRPPTPPHPPP